MKKTINIEETINIPPRPNVCDWAGNDPDVGCFAKKKDLRYMKTPFGHYDGWVCCGCYDLMLQADEAVENDNS